MQGYNGLARADVVIVIDVLCFSTCVDVAVARGAAILPYAWKDPSARDFATAQHAVLAGPRDEAEYNLSPASFLKAPPGLHCVLPSPNGAALAVHVAKSDSIVLTSCLRNAKAAAHAAARLGKRFSVCPAGERWPDGSLRPSLEDWLGAGAILSHLPGTKSPEAELAIAAFAARRSHLAEDLSVTGSGRELIERGFPIDIELAAQLDVSESVPVLRDGAFTRM